MNIPAVTSLSGAPVKPKVRVVILVVFFFILAGSLIQLVQGGRFIFFESQYKQTGWLAFLCLFPLIALLLLTCQPCVARMRTRYPSGWVRHLIMYPAVAAMVAAVLVAAPYGWILSAAWAFGSEQTPVTAKVVSVEEYRSRKGCDQYVTLSILSTQTKCCLADHYVGPPLQVGQEVVVSRKANSFGYLIGNFTAKSPESKP